MSPILRHRLRQKHIYRPRYLLYPVRRDIGHWDQSVNSPCALGQNASDSSGCDGYKAACKVDCSANSGCDTYDFFSGDDDSSSSGGSSGGNSSSSSHSTEHTQKCASANVVEYRDMDGDGCTDGFVPIESCDGSCNNAVCVEDTGQDETRTEDGDQPAADRSITDRIVAAVQSLLARLGL